MPSYLSDSPDITADVLDLRRRIAILENKSSAATQITTASAAGVPPTVTPGGVSDGSVTYAKLAPDVATTFDVRYVNVTGDTMTGSLAVNAPVTIGTGGAAQSLIITGTLSATGTASTGNLNATGTVSASTALSAGVRGISGSPTLDFHSSISPTNYDARFTTTGGTAADGAGSLAVLAANISLPVIASATTVANTLTVSGAYATNLGGALNVTGQATFNGGFSITGNETIGGTLAVAGATALNGGISSSVVAQTDNTYFAWDAGSARLGFSKKAGVLGKLAYANGTFAITQYVGQTGIDPSQAQTDRLTIDPSGNVGITVGLTTGTLAVTTTSTFTGAAALNGGISTKDIVTGGGGAGVGNIASATIDTYNLKDGAVTNAKLSPGALAASGTPAGTANNGRAKLLRYVTANPATKDAAGQNLDNLQIISDSAVSRVIDSQAYGGNAILVQSLAWTMSSGSLFQLGPYYGSDTNDYVGSPGFAPGQYRVTVYAKVTSTASALPILGLEAHCATTGVLLNDSVQYTFRASDLNTYYVGASFPMYVQADTRNTAGLEIRSHYYTGSGADLRISHIQVEPWSGLSQGEVSDTYIKDLSVTNAKIANLSASKITAGTITADITQSGTFRTGPDGGARVVFNSGGIYAYDGSNTNTAAILTNGQVSITGTVNATGGAFTGVVTGGTFRGGIFETAAGNVSVVRHDAAGVRAYDAGGLLTFNLKNDGSLVATNVNISGTVNSVGGSFSGELYGNGITGARISTSRSLATRNPEGANGTSDWVDVTDVNRGVVSQVTGGPVGAGYAIAFAYGQSYAQISPPVQTAPIPATSGGTLATGTYYYVVTALNPAGETNASNEFPAAVVGPTGSVAVSWQAVVGATNGYKVYRGTATGAENVLVATTAATAITDTGGGTAGSPSATNTTGNLRAYSVMNNYLFSSPGVIKAGDLVTASFYARLISGDGVVTPSIRHTDGTSVFMPAQAAITVSAVFTRYTYTFNAGVDADQLHTLYLSRVNLQTAANIQVTGVQIEFGPAATAYGSGQQRIDLTSLGLKAYNLAGQTVTSIDSTTGLLTTTNANVTGTINATGGTFSGNIDANSLTITGGSFKATNITGSNINATNSISGQAITAGTLTAGSLSIASSFGDSAILNGGFEDETSPGSAVPTNWTFHYETSGSGATFQRTTANPYTGSARGSITVGLNVGDSIASSSIPVTPGDTWQVRGEVRAEGGQTGPFYVRVYFGTVKDFPRNALVGTTPTGSVTTGLSGFNGAGYPGYYDIVSGQSAPAQNTWYPLDAVVTVPSGASWMRLALYTWINGLGGWVGNFDGFTVRQQLTSTSIADGTITTNKIDAQGISGKVITAGTLTADKIGTGTLTASTSITAGGPVGSQPAVLIDGRSGNAGLRLLNASGGTVVDLNAVTGGATFTGRINATSGVFTGQIDNTAGTFLGGLIQGATYQSAASGTRLVIRPNGTQIQFFDTTSTQAATLSTYGQSGGQTGIQLSAGGSSSFSMSGDGFALLTPRIDLNGSSGPCNLTGTSMYFNAGTSGSMQIGNGSSSADMNLYGGAIGIHATNGLTVSGNLQVNGSLTQTSLSAPGGTASNTFNYYAYSHVFHTNSGLNPTFDASANLTDVQSLYCSYANSGAGFFHGYSPSSSYGVMTTSAIYSNSAIYGIGGVFDNGGAGVVRVYSPNNPPPAQAAQSVNYQGQNIANSYLNDNPLMIRTASDTNHQLVYDGSIDGPSLRGYGGVSFYSGGTRYAYLNGTQFHTQDLYYSNSLVHSSSITLKNTVVDMPHGLSVINALRPVQYRLNSQAPEDQTVYGAFIAEEIALALPEAARENEGVPAYDPTYITATLVRAVQELSAEVTALRALIDTN